MEMNIGKKIRELRQQMGRTQTEIAEVFGVSPQAVSRWENGTVYPDMELIPSIANYFGVTIDSLFGYQSQRETRINAIIEEANNLAVYDNGRDVNIEKRLTLLRNGLVEFPGNEKIMYELAATLSNAGWVRCGEHIRYDEKGYLVHKVEIHQENEYWNESIKLFEAILEQSKDPTILNDSTYNLTLLYCNLGQYEKGLALSERMPPLAYSRELMRTYATDGESHYQNRARALLKLANEFSDSMVQTLMSREANFKDDLPVRMLTGVLQIYDLLFEDGNMGPYHSHVADLLLYLSEHQWRCGMHDEVFASLDRALEHMKAYDALAKSGENYAYTSPLLNGISMDRVHWAPYPISPNLSEDWPMWMKPDFDDVYAEMSADPRWDDWVRRTKES